MKPKKSLHLVIIIILICNWGCKKEPLVGEQPGLVFYPSKFELNNYRVSGIALNNAEVSFANSVSLYNILKVNGGKDYYSTNGFYKYNLITNNVTSKNIDYGDTAKLISGLINVNPNLYIGFNSSKTKYTTVNGLIIYALTILKLDGDGNTLKELTIPEGTIHEYGNHLKVLGNGNIILTTATGSYFSKNYMICFDEDLNIKWKVNIENSMNFSDDYFIQDILIKNNAIYLLQKKISNKNSYFSFDNFRVKKYDFTGNFVNASSNSVNGYEGNAIIPSDNGYLVVGAAYNSAIDYKTFISGFDLDNNLTGTKFLGPVNYKDSYNITYNSPVVSSNIIQSNNSYYFMTLEYQLVKLNKSFDIEWVKTIDKFSPGYPTNDRYLINIGDKLVCIGRNNWSGLDGITFIKTDLDGKVVK